MKLVMTLLVRDEEDVLAANFECHLSQGVDFFIVTDNLSIDGTRDIIEQYVRDGVAVCLEERNDDYSQARWVTKMARLAAARYEADWVINSDADEFWIGSSANGIKEDLASIDPRALCAVVSRSNFLPTDEEGVGFFAERMMICERQSRNAIGELLPPKVCHRAFQDIQVDQGNHVVRRDGLPLKGVPGALHIRHYPARSYRQFENKIVKGGAAYARNTELPSEIGHAWRYLYKCWKAGGLRAYYRQIMRSPQAVTRDLESGELIYDDTLLRILRHRVRDPLLCRATSA
jgi:hypothetical protein